MSRKTHQQDQAKAAANAEKLAELNANVVHVAEGRDGQKRAHRVTCKRVPADHFETTPHTAVNLHHAVAASCCKPQLPDPISDERKTELLAGGISDVLAGADPLAVAERIKAEAGATDPEPVGSKPTGAEIDAHRASKDRVERTALAKAEAKALQAWEKGGQQGDRPATPNLDAVQAQYANGGAKAAKAEPTARGRRGPSYASPEYAKAMEAKKAGKRGAGRKVTDDELADHVRKVRATHPDWQRNEALEIAYWLDGLALTRARWNQAWEATEAAAKAS